MTPNDAELDAVARLNKDLAKAAHGLSKDEARFLVDAYYTTQGYRIAASNQVRSLNESGEPSSVLQWLMDQQETLEGQIKRALDKWSDAQPLGVWLKSIVGIGPVIASGLMAHIDIRKAPTEGHIWNFAGLNPNQAWNKGEKRPWNADLKVLTWKAGESFVKTSGNERALYGKLYKERKELEVKWNEEGRNVEAAAKVLASKRIGKETVAYASYAIGKLPAAHTHARARRWAVKMFLSHYHVAAMWLELGQVAPLPYVIAHLNHVDRIMPPSMDLLPGWAEAHKERYHDDPQYWVTPS